MRVEEFLNIADKQRPRLAKTAVSLLGDADEAEDAVQDTLLRLWEVREVLMPSVNVEAYAFTILRHCCIDKLRHRRPTVPVDMDGRDVAPQRATSADRMEDADNARWLRQRVSLLPEAQRRMWKMYQHDRLTTAQIADILGISELSVRNAISMARKKLTEELMRRNKKK